MLTLTTHARQQMARRAVSEAMLLATLDNGDEYRQKGGTFAYFMSRRAVVKTITQGLQVPDCEGLTIIVSPGDDGLLVVTCHWEGKGGKLTRRIG